ncbi:oligosaccharide flippase family protein [Pseudothermotoga sp.]|uniref:lipopolysaccharide biosynthesis protein n=1 Tax=Pseudothermotoga sp. TaxID=2033661 RepID=UPI000E9F3816|nr:oligosaccharide flippase family protein [Pseudothermotoga sp.]HBJ80722.1 hypothetical protein [Pseudothermotoga sp.]
MEQYRKLAINTFLFAIGNIGSRSISFLLLPLFTRYMIPSDYGRLGVINTTVQLLVPLLSFQIVEAIFRFAADVREVKRGKNVFSNAFFFSFLSFVFSVSFYPLLRNVSIFAEFNMYFYSIFFLTVLNSIVKQFIRGLGRVNLFVVSDMLYSGIFAVSSVVLLVLMKLGIRAYLLSNIIALVSSTLFIFFYANLVKYLSPRIDIKSLKEMLSFSIPLIPNGIMWWVINASDRYLLSYFIGYEATGMYSVAAMFPSILTTLYAVFFQAWQLSAIEEFGEEGYSKFFKNVFGVLSSVMFIGLSLLFLIIKTFMKFYVGYTYFESWRYTIFLLLGTAFHAFASFYGVNYVASKKTIGAFSTSVIAATTKVTVVLSLIKVMGIQAASISTFLAYLVMWVSRVFHTRETVQMGIDIRHFALSTTTILAQAIALLTIKSSVTLYATQMTLLTLTLWFQRKYVAKAIRFGKSLVKSIKKQP